MDVATWRDLWSLRARFPRLDNWILKKVPDFGVNLLLLRLKESNWRDETINDEHHIGADVLFRFLVVDRLPKRKVCPKAQR